MSVRIVIWLFLSLILTGCSLSGAPKIIVSDLTVREAQVDQPTAGDLNFSCICDLPSSETSTQAFMVIHNQGLGPDRLVKVETDAAVKVELKQPNTQGGIELLAESIDALEIPVWRKIIFQPGEYQMSLLGLKGDLLPGEKVKLRLTFEQSGVMEVEALITAREE